MSTLDALDASALPQRDVRIDVVVPTIGRPGLGALVATLLDVLGRPTVVHVVDDRPVPDMPLLRPADASRVLVHRSHGRGPAAARNVGWRASDADWIAFVDDDVVIPRSWGRALREDLADVPDDVAAVTGRIEVPAPEGRAPTDDERQVLGLATAAWVTADFACRRAALEEIGGFDERFARAYREDTDLVIRLRGAGHVLRRGTRHVVHPVRQGPWWSSVARQRGNADDALLLALHGPERCADAGMQRGGRRRHVLTTGLLALATTAAVGRRRGVALGAGAGWLALTADLAHRRIAAGPRDPREVAAMVASSVLVPPAATAWWVWGRVRAPR